MTTIYISPYIQNTSLNPLLEIRKSETSRLCKLSKCEILKTILKADSLVLHSAESAHNKLSVPGCNKKILVLKPWVFCCSNGRFRNTIREASKPLRIISFVPASVSIGFNFQDSTSESEQVSKSKSHVISVKMVFNLYCITQN